MQLLFEIIKGNGVEFDAILSFKPFHDDFPQSLLFRAEKAEGTYRMFRRSESITYGFRELNDARIMGVGSITEEDHDAQFASKG